MSTNKYVCIHGHFYQPPRENAWLEVVELQDSAAPFHDWNARINFECYAPNTSARILNPEGKIQKIINNYTRINFNFGPTLLSWLESEDTETYNSIIEADKISMEKNGGHGNAIAQVHSHLILPLANEKDKHTQVLWGLKDFEYRFGRKAEGIWLAETAANTDTLEVLAEYGVKYTILAPRQLKAFKKIGDDAWVDSKKGFDVRRPYHINLPSGKSIAVFFYDGVISQEVAFNKLLDNGKRFAERFLTTFDKNDEPQLVHIATDGESYGHHHRYGEMALADCLNHIEQGSEAQLINYAYYLEKYPPTYEAQIHENSSWSCVHGVERWKSNCGCNSGGNQGWTQEWRPHLRSALDWLRDELAIIFDQEGSKYLKDPWKTRDEFIFVLLNRDDYAIKEFLGQHVIKTLSKKEKTTVLRLLEMQRNALYMYTSCGWFFDEISGIETNQILQYSLRAIEFVKQVASRDLSEEFIKRLENAPSNVFNSGAESYRKYVEPAKVDLARVGMHYATMSIFENQSEIKSFFNYEAHHEIFERKEAGNQRISVGRTTVRSRITHSEKLFSFAVLYLGQQNIIGNISVDMDKDTFVKMKDQILSAFETTNLGEVIGIMQNYFGGEKYTIWHLFRDEKRKILRSISRKSLDASEAVMRDIFNDNYQLMSGMNLSNIPVPSAFKSAAEFILNTDLHRFFIKEHLDIAELDRLKDEFSKWDLNITNQKALKLSVSERIFYELRKLALSNYSFEQINVLNKIFSTLKEMKIDLDIWKSQNLYFKILNTHSKGELQFKDEATTDAFYQLGSFLKVQLQLSGHNAS